MGAKGDLTKKMSLYIIILIGCENLNNEILFKPNSLIMATANSSNISATEYKLFDTIFQRCQYNGFGWKIATLSRDEMKSIIKNNDDSSISNIKSTLDKFRDIKLSFKLGTKFVSGSVIAEYTYDEATDIFTCSMSDNIYTVLMEYAKYGYSPIDLKIVRNARGYYTQRIYGMLRRWSKYKNIVIIEYTLEEIKSVCGISSGTSYDEYKNFRKRILDPAVNEINQKLGMEVVYKPIKVIRKVQKIEFTVKDNVSKHNNFKNDKIIESKGISEVAVDKIEKEEIDSIDYMNLIDFRINESVHEIFLKDFYNYKDYILAVKTASEKTINTIGGKTINKRNYKYFKTVLEGLIPETVK